MSDYQLVALSKREKVCAAAYRYREWGKTKFMSAKVALTQDRLEHWTKKESIWLQASAGRIRNNQVNYVDGVGKGVKRRKVIS